MNKYFVSIKTKDNLFKKFKVQKEVYIYIKILETAIRYPTISKFKEVYHEKFK